MPAVIKFLDELGFGPKFIDHASKMIGEESAYVVWEKMLAKGGYSFNASHAYAYGLISYHDAKLKVAGPADFYAGYLSTAKSKDLPSKLAASMREGSKFGTKIKPPDINLSGAEFTVTDRHTILYGLEAVKGVGPVGIREILTQRPFRTYDQFDNAIPGRAINKNGRKALIGAGAFDFVGLRSLMSEAEKASNEEAYIGVKLSGKSDLEKYATLIEETVHNEDEFDAADHGESLCLGGEIIAIKETFTKQRGDAMGFVTIAYGSESFRVTLFPKVWSAYRSILVEGKVVFFEGRKDVSDQYGAGFIGFECIELATLVAMNS
jgi:DNA polymerase-3 subunit alpha